jgi:predicted GIY-YIG superfamily endonuclease
MPDYKKAIIYKITTGDNIYIGSTCNFTKRKWAHKNSIYNEKTHHYNLKLYQTIRENNGEWDMKPYKEYPCENKTQLTIEEDRIRCELNADLNMRLCGTGLNKKEYNKQYRNENKEQEIEYFKQYYQKNKEKISEKLKEKITCECGCVVNRYNLSRHKKTKKHIELMEKNSI